MRHAECYCKNYPRPQFVRKIFIDLNGSWRFLFDFDNVGEGQKWFLNLPKEKTVQIEVPYAYQTPASGIGEQKRCDHVWYERKIDHVVKEGERLLLNFEGADYKIKVWLNGVYLGSHSGAYARATFEATAAVRTGENILVVKAEDSYSCRRPRGKQRSTDKSYTCWYVDTTGLWKSVWAETVDDTFIRSLHITPSVDDLTVTFEGEIDGSLDGLTLSVDIRFRGREIASQAIAVKDSRFKSVINLACEAHFFSDMFWRGGEPNLYDVSLSLLCRGKALDNVGSYFGMVKYRAENRCINVNDSPVYLKMLLDQGYWTNSHLTPPNEDAIEKDVLLTLEAGFNGIRKHQKIEDERFYYYCDILAVYVWCEMPSMYEFCNASISTFYREWTEVVEQMRNHPCIMTYVPLNESWGAPRIHTDVRQQQFSEALYFITKTLDPLRLVVANDGWDNTRTDLATLHNYAPWGKDLSKITDRVDDALLNYVTEPSVWRHAFAEGYSYSNQPVLLSEFGGIAFCADMSKGWGYGGLVESEQVYLDRLNSLIDAVKACGDICGYCLTQTTDVQQEVNGIMTEDRRFKISIYKLREIIRK